MERVCETIKNLIFPLKWKQRYSPYLSDHLADKFIDSIDTIKKEETQVHFLYGVHTTTFERLTKKNIALKIEKLIIFHLEDSTVIPNHFVYYLPFSDIHTQQYISLLNEKLTSNESFFYFFAEILMLCLKRNSIIIESFRDSTVDTKDTFYPYHEWIKNDVPKTKIMNIVKKRFFFF